MKLRYILLLIIASATSYVQAQTTQRNALVEDFSNAECSPCKTLSDELYPAIVSMGSNEPDSHLNTIAYQLNYPGYDPSYNIHARQRELFYQMNGLPALKVNGIATNPMFNTQQYEYILDTSRDRPSRFIFEGEYKVDEANRLLNINFWVKPLVSMQGPYKVHTVVAERHYTNSESSIGMFEYHFVMRRMFPDGNGKAATSWTANTMQHFQYEVPYQVINPPVSGGFDFWGNPLMSDLVVFIQDTVTKEILQSQVFKPEMPTSISTPGDVKNVMLYPNPANDVVRLAFDMRLTHSVILSVTDLSGRILQEQTYTNLIPGRHEINFVTKEFKSGTYLLQLNTAGEKLKKIFSVVR